MTNTARAQFRRLSLQIERLLVKQSRLQRLLTFTDRAVADERQQLRTVKARIKRTSPKAHE